MRLAFIGAGQVNFGGGEGPWNHAARFEQIPTVACVGVADIDLRRAQKAVAKQQSGPVPKVWAHARPFASWQQMVDEVRPNAVVIGLPPSQHGRPEGPQAVEVELAQRGISMLIEKPISSSDPDEVSKVADELRQHQVTVSVAYMFRYARWVRMLRQALEVVAPNVVLARYNCAYSTISKAEWWSCQRSGGPIIEQATHFLDLARHIGGEVDLRTIHVVRIGADSPRGQLCDMPTRPDGHDMEHGVPLADRIPRATLAHWRFTTGAIGSLCHGVQLHDRRYEAEFEAWGDGVRCVMRSPYDAVGELEVRHPHENHSHRIQIEKDDPYESEDRAFLEAVSTGTTRGIESTYDDALQTYRLTWCITHA